VEQNALVVDAQVRGLADEMQMRGNLNKEAAILAQTLNVKLDQLGRLKVFIRVSLTERKTTSCIANAQTIESDGGRQHLLQASRHS
jgi:hypothetical protein